MFAAAATPNNEPVPDRQVLDRANLVFDGGSLPTAIDRRVARMSESEIQASGASGPLLLENRIQVLRLAAEILRFHQGAAPIDPPVRDIITTNKAVVVSALATELWLRREPESVG
jgi:hypothetical protein